MNHSPRNRVQIQLHNGISSLLLIIIILCLVSFAILSIASAAADQRLTRRILDRTESYYAACNDAEEKIAQIDHTLADVYHAAADEAEYFASVGKSTSFFIDISDTQRLYIELTYQYPEDDDDSFYQITRWQIATDTSALEYDETLPVADNVD
ncbi:MAG: hypothetical protein K6G23_04010 [Lachnospiraceae bacterium]|nr:hypothetical protein [Lachnospiraceae bacterium]